MTDGDQVHADVVADATSHGWVDKEQFKGPAEKWVDAKTFMDRAETFIPFLQKTKRETEHALGVERQARERLEADLEASRKSIETLTKLNEETRSAEIESAKKEIKAQIAEAIKDGNTDLVGELIEQSVKLNLPPAKAAPVEEDEEAPPEDKPKLHPDFTEWVKQNPWYGTDAYKSDLAMTEARRLRRSGDTSTGMDFFDKVSAGVDKMLRPGAGRSKVEPGNLGGGNDLTGESSYDNLPAEAKIECDKDGKRRVGADKPYKSLSDWRKRYAEIYFSQPGVTRQ
jgi:hypothetical protein